MRSAPIRRPNPPNPPLSTTVAIHVGEFGSTSRRLGLHRPTVAATNLVPRSSRSSVRSGVFFPYGIVKRRVQRNGLVHFRDSLRLGLSREPFGSKNAERIAKFPGNWTRRPLSRVNWTYRNE